MKWTDEAIVEWHKKTFPDADLPSQLMKLEEELKEFYEATKLTDHDSIMQEIADIYIVSVVLARRYHSRIGVKYLKDFGFSDVQIIEYVSNKMDKNVNRKWCKINGVYRHKDIDTD